MGKIGLLYNYTTFTGENHRFSAILSAYLKLCVQYQSGTLHLGDEIGQILTGCVLIDVIIIKNSHQNVLQGALAINLIPDEGADVFQGVGCISTGGHDDQSVTNGAHRAFAVLDEDAFEIHVTVLFLGL